MGVLLRESSHAGIVISCPEIVSSALYIEVFPAVTEGVGVCTHAVFFIAESVVGVGFRLRSGSADKAHHVAVDVEGIIFGCACGAGDEICATEIRGRKRVILFLLDENTSRKVPRRFPIQTSHFSGHTVESQMRDYHLVGGR